MPTLNFLLEREQSSFYNFPQYPSHFHIVHTMFSIILKQNSIWVLYLEAKRLSIQLTRISQNYLYTHNSIIPVKFDILALIPLIQLIR